MLYGFPTFQAYLNPFIVSLPSADPRKESDLDNAVRVAMFDAETGWPLSTTLELSSFYIEPDKVERERKFLTSFFAEDTVIARDPAKRAAFLVKLKADLKLLFAKHREIITDEEIAAAFTIFDTPDHPLAENLFKFKREARVQAVLVVYLLAKKYRTEIRKFQEQLKLFIGKDTDRSCFGNHGFYRKALALCNKNDVYDQCAAIAIIVQQERRSKDLTFLGHTATLIEAACRLFLDAINVALTEKRRTIELELLHNDALNEFIILYNETEKIIGTLAITDRLANPKVAAELAYQLLFICSELFDRIHSHYELGQFFKAFGLKDTFKIHFNPTLLRAACQTAFDLITTRPEELDPSTPTPPATPPSGRRPATAFLDNISTSASASPGSIGRGGEPENPVAAPPVDATGDPVPVRDAGAFAAVLDLKSPAPSKDHSP